MKQLKVAPSLRLLAEPESTTFNTFCRSTLIFYSRFSLLLMPHSFHIFMLLDAIINRLDFIEM